ncbi:MAG: nuclear transport factor 2 family protein [Gaiellaceae bacterium]
MQESPEARDALLAFYEAFSKAAPGDIELFDRVFTREDDLLIVGTAFHEWVAGRERGTQSWGMEGVGLEPGNPVAWEDGNVAWAADRPAFVVGDIRAPIRLSLVMLREGGKWKIQHGHFSVGVPDEVAFENAGEWSTAAPAH